ncbi:MAG: hypothetical protein FWC92_08430 [Defluviitaleaceae bacterium]|nr:hypothetical protein [Defluviitaleaceae bacterium]
MKNMRVIFIAIALLMVSFFIWLFSTSRILRLPLTIEPLFHYGLYNSDRGLFARYVDGSTKPNHVYIFGVFINGGAIEGKEVTHMIDAQELVELISNASIRRWPFNSTYENSQWSIYFRQNDNSNGTMHIMLGGNNIIALSRANGVARRQIFGGDAISLALERMINEYNSQ